MSRNNVRIITLFLLISIFCQGIIISQIEVNRGDELPYTPENIIQNVFLGDGVEVIGINYSGDASAVGVFNNAQSYIDLDYGIILSTGQAQSAGLPNQDSPAGESTSGTSVTDTDLQALANGADLVDIAKYEIVFKPDSDTIRFRYVFASEEYPEFVCSAFNDIFGFFISGPNPDGGDYVSENIALVPDPSDPSGTSFLNNNVSINSVNNGMIGNLGTNVSFCEEPEGSLAFSQYYNDVTIGDYPVYDGYLNVFIAQAVVQPCEEYTIKLAIGDRQDSDFDSAVFLEAKSFNSNVLEVNLNTESVDGSIAEGCSSAIIEINLPRVAQVDYPIEVTTIPFGTFPDQAEPGVDHPPISTNLFIPAGSSNLTLELDAIEDNLVEGDEFIYLDLIRSACIRDTLKIRIRDRILTQVMLPPDTVLCENSLIRLIPEYEPPISLPPKPSFRSQERIVLENKGESYLSSIEVTDLEPDNLGYGVLNRVCIDTLVARNLYDLDIFLIGPHGQILELSTDNGDHIKPTICESDPLDPICIDTFLNTCFSVNATQNINNGDAFLGPSFTGNLTYTGTYLPEGDWDEFLVNNESANGEWQLLVRPDQEPSAQDLLNGFSYLNGWTLFFNAAYDINHFWSPDYSIFCTECDTTFVSNDLDTTYTVLAVDSYGCETTESIFIDALPVSDVPVLIECVALSPSSVRITWEDLGPDVEFYDLRMEGIPPWFQTSNTSFVFNGLEAGATTVIWLRAYNGECNSGILEVECTTLPCESAPPVINDIVVLPPSCDGEFDGQILVDASSQVSGQLTFYVNGFINSDGMFTSLAPREYLVRVVDDEGCSTVQTVIVPEATDLDYSAVISPISCVGEEDASVEIIVNTDLNPPYSIEWEDMSDSYTQAELGMGTYEFTITDAGDCAYALSIDIEDPAPLAFDEINASPPLCFGEQGSIELIMGGGNPGYSFDWEDSIEDSNVLSLDPGVYAVTVSDTNGCEISTDVEIFEMEVINAVPDTIQSVCIDELSQEINLEITGGVGPFMVQWTQDIEGVEVVDLEPGMYELTITDDNDCVILDTVELTNHPDLEINFDLIDPECFNSLDGIISIVNTVYTDGVELDDFQIEWGDGQVTEAIGSLLGNEYYAYTITDGFGCLHIDSIFLTGPPAILAEVDTLSVIECFDDMDGSFEVTYEGGTGDLDIAWSSNIEDITGNVASGLGEGNYGVSITDEEGCELEIDIVFDQPSLLEYDFDQMDVECFDENSGSIQGMVLGGTAPYEIDWSNGASSDSIFDLPSGMYSILVTDDNGCTVEADIEIEQPDGPLEVVVEAFETKCNDTDTGSMEIEITGGTSPYIVLVDSINYFDNTSITGLAAGTYDVNVIDLNGCTFDVFDIVIEEAPIRFVELGMDTTVEFGSDVFVDYETNVDNLIEFTWETSSAEVNLSCDDCPNPTIQSLEVQFNLVLTAKDANGCKYITSRFFFISDESFVEVPTGFSPDGNGRNDKLVVYGKPGVKIMEFEIFDRWGELLYIDEDFDVNNEFRGWDGTFRGTEADSGVYVWKIRIEKLSGEEKFFEGTVTLLR